MAQIRDAEAQANAAMQKDGAKPTKVEEWWDDSTGSGGNLRAFRGWAHIDCRRIKPGIKVDLEVVASGKRLWEGKPLPEVLEVRLDLAEHGTT